MLVYILFILLIFLLRGFLSRIPLGKTRDKKEREYLLFVAGVLLVLTAIRGASVGTDTRNYLIMYVHYIPNYSFTSVYTAFEGAPLAFYLFKVFSLLKLPPQLLLGFIEFIYLSAIIRLINKYSVDKLYSFFCFFIIVGLYELSIPALKQTLAMGLALHAFMDFCDKKRMRGVLCLVLAYFFHKSSLVFLLGVLLYYLRDKKYYYYLVGIMVLLFLVAKNTVLSTMLNILDDEHYMNYLQSSQRYSWTTFIYYFILLISALFFKKQYDNHNLEESRVLYGFVMVALGLQSLSSVVATAFRLASYYVPFFVVLLPNSFSLSSKTGRGFKLFVTLLLLFFYFYTNRNGGNIVPYKFFWQDYDIPYLNFGG